MKISLKFNLSLNTILIPLSLLKGLQGVVGSYFAGYLAYKTGFFSNFVLYKGLYAASNVLLLLSAIALIANKPKAAGILSLESVPLFALVLYTCLQPSVQLQPALFNGVGLLLSLIIGVRWLMSRKRSV